MHSCFYCNYNIHISNCRIMYMGRGCICFRESHLLHYNLGGVFLLLLLFDNSIRKYAYSNFVNSVLKCKIYFIVSFLIICWIPCLLSNFPGILISDAGWQWSMARGEVQISSHHPPLHTLLIWFSQKLSVLLCGTLNSTIAVSLYSFIQMLLLAISFGITLKYIDSYNKSSWLFFASIFYYALHPLNAIAGIYMTKDIVFSICILLFTLQLYSIYITEGKFLGKNKNCFIILFLILCISNFRNTGTLIIIFSLLLLLWNYKAYYKKILLLFFVLLISIQLRNGLYDYLQITKPDIAESLGMPINQIARVIVNEDQVSDEDKLLINNVLDINKIKVLYNPHYSDPIKFNSAFSSEPIVNNRMDYLSLWIRMIIAHPKECLEATANLTIGYWYPGVHKGAVSYNIQEKENTLISIGVNPWSFSGFDKFYDYFIGTNVRENIFLSWLFSVGNVFIFIIFCCSYLCAHKYFKAILVLAPNILIWFTLILAAPSYCETRYFYSAFICIPLYLLLLMNSENKNIQKNYEHHL